MFYAVFEPEDDPSGSKHVGVINTINLVVLTVLICVFMSTLKVTVVFRSKVEVGSFQIQVKNTA